MCQAFLVEKCVPKFFSLLLCKAECAMVKPKCLKFAGLNDWVQLPEMHCPRAQPAVLGHGGLVYVMGGRNSKKVELKSVECYDPLTNLWTLWDTDSYSLRKKRWASAAVPFAQDNLLLIGGRGKWTANTVEVFSLPTKQWQLAAHSGVKGHDKRYSACTVTKPHDRWGP